MSKDLVKVQEKNITDVVLNRVAEKFQQGAIHLPENYSPQNALSDAYLQLQDMQVKGKSVLEVCTKASVTSALYKMVTQGLNPAKGQCYFIPYGDKLEMQRSYLGSIALAKQTGQVDDVKGYPVYKGDEFKLGFDVLTGKQTLEAYTPSTERKDGDLIGAFAMVIKNGESIHVEYMTLQQIKAAWNQGQMKGSSPAHKNFPDQMAVKTVINRAAKYFIGTSDDEGLRATDSMITTDEEVDGEIEEMAHTEEFEPVEYEDITEEIPGDIDPETGEIIPDNPELDAKAPF